MFNEVSLKSNSFNRRQMTMTFGERLKEILKERGLQQQEFARISGLSNATVSAYITGKRLPSTLGISKIEKALDMKFDVECSYYEEQICEEIIIIFIKNLKKALQKKNMTQRELALKANLTEATISCYCNGKSNPSLTHLKILSDALDVKISELVE